MVRVGPTALWESGKPSAFEAFVREYQDMVFATAVRLLGRESDAEDVAQTVFLKALERFDTIGDSPEVPGWLKTVTTNLCLNHLSRYRSRWRLFSEMGREDDAPGERYEASIPGGTSPAAALDDTDRRQGLERALRAQEAPVPPTPAAAPAAPTAPAAPSGGQAPRAPVAPRAPAGAIPVVPPDPGRIAQDGPPNESAEAPRDRVRERASRGAVRIFQDFSLAAGETARDVVVVAGTNRVEGEIFGDLVTIAGSLDLGSSAIVHGNVVVVAGSAVVAPGAVAGGDMVVVGGTLDAPATFRPRGEFVVVGNQGFGRAVRGFLPWITSGLMLGRVVVPSLAWVWGVLVLVLLLSLLVLALFERTVRACMTPAVAKPITTFLIGLLALLLLGPMVLILSVSVIGIPVIPFLFVALFLGGVLGKIAVARALGTRIVAEDDAEDRMQAVRSFLIGFTVLTVLYMLPVLGLLTWLLVGVLGLGAATAALLKALRRENPSSPRTVAPPPVSGTPAPEGAAPVSAIDTAGSAAYATATSPVGVTVPPAEGGPGHPHQAFASSYGATDAALLALPRAAFLPRVTAGLLDVMLVGMVFGLMEVNRREMFWFLTLLTAYVSEFWTWRGTTIGGLILQLRVVRTDGVPLRFSDSAIRGVSSLFSLWVFGLGFFWILRDPEQQAWHDKIAGTIVVRVPKSLPLRG